MTRPGWRDPRLWVGIALVAACIVAGARLVGSADDTVQVWALADRQGPGVQLSDDDLVLTRVRFADSAELESYYRVDDELPETIELLHGVGAGELLPRSAVGTAGDSGLMQLPLTADPSRVPPTLRGGSEVDVYLLGDGVKRAGTAALEGVPVVSVRAPDQTFSASGRTQVTVAVEPEDVDRYFRRIAGATQPTVHIVPRG